MLRVSIFDVYLYRLNEQLKTINMKAYKSTQKLRAELDNGFCYVRNLEEKGGVISACVQESREKHIALIINSIEDESFSEIWDLLNQVKHVRFEFSRN